MKNQEDELREAIELACQPQNSWRIMAGRKSVTEMDRDFVLGNIEKIARDSLDLEDYWEYRRLIELCDSLSSDLARRVASWGLVSDDEDVREESTDCLQNTEQENAAAGERPGAD